MRGAQRVSRCGSQGGGRGKEERRGKEKVSGGSGGDVHAKFDEQRRIGDERKISVRKSSRKTGLNKTSVKEGLVSFYEGNEQQAELVLKVILDNLPVKESTSLALTGIKEKKQE